MLFRTFFRFIKMASKSNVVFILGAPGSGKGTQCEKIVQKFGYVHLSAGDLLREERNTPGSPHGEEIENCIRNGLIVPVEVTCRLIDKAMQKSGKTNFLIDGFPRNRDNLEGWNKEMSEKANVQFILFISCTEDECTERCLKRGAAGSGRSDDNIDSLRKRFKTFYHDTMPIVKHFEQKDMVLKVDGTKDADAVFESIRPMFEKFQ